MIIQPCLHDLDCEWNALYFEKDLNVLVGHMKNYFPMMCNLEIVYNFIFKGDDASVINAT
jgi:hypothetical protein